MSKGTILKERYESKSLSELEHDISQASCKGSLECIERLFYLRYSRRFKEDPAYKGKLFRDYVAKKIKLPYETYLELMLDYLNGDCE